jgi:cytidine deaminase
MVFPTAAQKQELAARARAVRSAAYAPYSGFPVGAAILAEDGRIFTGCNVENLSFGATICAERTAVVKAVSEGAVRFSAVAVISREETPCLPCGICRQFLSEFACPDMPLLACRADGSFQEFRFGEILPHAFQTDIINRGGTPCE